MFETCPRTWYMKYVQKIPRIEDLVYAHRGTVVHYCLENYYPDKKLSMDELKEMFDEQWTKYKLHESKLSDKKDETWNMIVNGVNLDLNLTSTELKIFYPDVVGYIDAVDSHKSIITDWKTSTRSSYNELEYIKQVKFYAWLYYRKFNQLPEYTEVRYLKYDDDKSSLGCEPTMEDIKEMEEWHINIRKKMQYYIDNPNKLPEFNKNYFFCPYKHMWDLHINKDEIQTFIITLYGNFFYVEGLNKFLIKHFDEKYSYELQSARFIKKRNPNANTNVRLFSKKFKRFNIGFLKEVIKSLKDYAMWKDKKPVIEIIDKREIDNTIIKMPDKLLSGKTLRPYQEDAVKTYLNNDKIGILEITTGGGKTLIVTEIIRRLGVKTWFIVDSQELMTQAKETLEDNLGINIGLIGDGKRDIKDVTVVSIQTIIKILDYRRRMDEFKRNFLNRRWKEYCKLYKIVIPNKDNFENNERYEKYKDVFNNKKKNFIRTYILSSNEKKEINDESERIKKDIDKYKKIINEVRFLIEDECHKAGAKSYYKLGSYMKNTEYRLGITATAFRDDGNDMMMHATLGPIIYSLKGQELNKKGYLIKPDIKFITLDIPDSEMRIMDVNSKDKNPKLNPDLDYLKVYKSYIVNNKIRNEQIKKICEINKGIFLILIKHIEHGKKLCNMIPGSQFVYGDTNSKKRKEILKKFKNGEIRVLISTLSIFAEGVDIPKLDNVINASANKGDVKSIQVLGRIMRKEKNKDKSVYYDFYDYYSCFYQATKSRMNIFKKEGYDIQRLII